MGLEGFLVEDAGRPTLARRLVDEGRCTLEQLEVYGRDLFEAVAYLDSQGVFHRDIKPDNLGVRASGSDRKPHVVLFDFSLATEPLEHTKSGTHGYLDPFLGSSGRLRYDSAAERFAVAATLFEMATGGRPTWGDGKSEPALIKDEVHLSAAMFEPEAADAFVEFFRKAFARSFADRFDDWESMAHAWHQCFPSVDSGSRDEDGDADLDALATSATLDTAIEQCGLSPRAVSAARRLGALTVQDLVDVSPIKINQLAGVGVVVRSELQRRVRQWRTTLAGLTVTQTHTQTQMGAAVGIRDIERTQLALVPGSRSKASGQAELARRLLNLTGDGAPLPDRAQAAEEVGQEALEPGSFDSLAAYWGR